MLSIWRNVFLLAAFFTAMRHPIFHRKPGSRGYCPVRIEIINRCRVEPDFAFFDSLILSGTDGFYFFRSSSKQKNKKGTKRQKNRLPVCMHACVRVRVQLNIQRKMLQKRKCCQPSEMVKGFLQHVFSIMNKLAFGLLQDTLLSVPRGVSCLVKSTVFPYFTVFMALRSFNQIANAAVISMNNLCFPSFFPSPEPFNNELIMNLEEV